MIMHNVTSTDIHSIGYDAPTNVLRVQFKSGGTYDYFNVPVHLYESFMQASSHGKFLNENIKYNYRYQKIN